MFDHQQVIKSRPGPRQSSLANDNDLRNDPFADLVRQVHDDPANPYNIERYLWVLEEPLRHCVACGDLFDPCFAYDGGPAHGLPRRYCSPRCAWRAAEYRRRTRIAVERTAGWGRAA